MEPKASVIDVVFVSGIIAFLGIFFADGPKMFIKRFIKNEYGGRNNLWETWWLIFKCFFVMGITMLFLENLFE